jgi:ABC-type multidrug transport system ATPase subunit
MELCVASAKKYIVVKVVLEKIGKRYNYEWIFRNINYEFSSENKYVILGANGSGKSTLLQLIAGNAIASEGNVNYSTDNISINQDDVYKHISYAAPYIELFEEFTLKESFEFHFKFKNPIQSLSTSEILSITELEKSANKQLKYFSSGMKQRVRLASAILSNTPILLLDEPTSNLDKKAIDWYQKLVNDYASNDRLIIVASNQQEYEYPFCNKELKVEDFK